MKRSTIVNRSSIFVVVCAVSVTTLLVVAQEGGTPVGPQPVIIQRRAVELSSADRYRVPLQLRPVREVLIDAPFDGTVQRVTARPGARVEVQFELVSLDNERVKLIRARAIAALDLAELRKQQAGLAGNAAATALAEAEIKVASAEIKIAEYDEKQSSIRAPYGGTVLDVFVEDGQRIQKGQPVVLLGDLGQLRCRVPVDRSSVQTGGTLKLNVEDQAVTGRVGSIVALTDELQTLRELSVSVALADVLIDNPSRTLREGQSVFAPLIPTYPVTRVPLDVVKSAGAGDRMVQVLRGHVVRNIPVTLHGQDGKTDVFVSGPFTEHDELLLSVSVELADGTAVRPSSADRFATAESDAATATGASGQRPGSKKKAVGPAGF